MTPLPSKHVLLKVLTFLVGDASLPGLLPPASFAASSRSAVTSQVLHLPVPRLDRFPRPRRVQRPAQTSRSLRRPARSPPARRTGSPIYSTVPLGGLRGCPCGFAPGPVKTFLLRLDSNSSHTASLSWLTHITACHVTICLIGWLPHECVSPVRLGTVSVLYLTVPLIASSVPLVYEALTRGL